MFKKSFPTSQKTPCIRYEDQLACFSRLWDRQVTLNYGT